MCKVSVIIPVYNGETYLAQCLDSIIGQTLKEIEIICVNDGSKDRTQQILEKYAEKDSRIQIISQENGGAGAARNAGLRIARGEYLSILDGDDFFESDMLEKAYKKAKESRAELLVFGSDQYYETTDEYKSVAWTIRRHALPPYRPMNYRQFTDNVFKVFVGWTWDKLFLRSFVEEQRLYFQEQRTSNDLLFTFLAIVTAKNIEVLDEVLIHQRRDNQNSLSNTREKSWTCFYEALLELREELKKRGLYHELEQDYINYALHFSLWNLETLNGPKKKELYQILKKTWFHELGIDGKKAFYFYQKGEYRKYQNIRKKSWRVYEQEQR